MAMGDDGARILHAEASRRRDYGDGRRREGLAVPAGPRFRPCLWRFFAKGTVGCTDYPAISTVPLTFFTKGTVGCALRPAVSTVPFPLFCKRHGRLRPLPRDFDRAFDDFL